MYTPHLLSVWLPIVKYPWVNIAQAYLPHRLLLTAVIMQDMLKRREEIPRAQALGKAVVITQTSKRKALSAETPEQPPLKSSKLLPKLGGQIIAASPLVPSRPSRHTAGIPGSAGGQQKGALAGGNAEPDDIRGDDFFMSSSADEAERDEQSVPVKASEFPAALPHKAIIPEQQQHAARDSTLHKHSNHRKSIQHRRMLPPGQTHGEQGHKPHAGATLPPNHKPVKHPHRHGGAVTQVARSKLSGKAQSQQSRGQSHGQAPSAHAVKQSPGAAPDKRPGQPLRTRAEGGRKRRK